MQNTKEILETNIEATISQINAIAENLDPQFSIRGYKGWNDYSFSIQDKDKNWTDFVTVKINNKGEASFSHGSGGWNGGFSQHEIMQSTIRSFELAQEIMNKKDVIAPLLVKADKMILELEAIREKEDDDARALAWTKCSEELGTLYEKTTPEQVVDFLKTHEFIDIIVPGRYSHNDNVVNTIIYRIFNNGLRTGGKMNLYVHTIVFDENGTHMNDGYRVAKKELHNFIGKGYVYNKEVQFEG